MATRVQLRGRARVRADQPGTFPTDTEYNDLLDESAKEVWYDLVGAGWPINFSSVTVTISGGVNVARLSSFAVTAPVAFIRGVFYLQGTTLTELRRVNEGDRASLLSTTGAMASYYDVRIDPADGPCVEILPYAAGSYVVQYVPEFPGFANDAASWYGPGGSDMLIVLLAAMKGMRKEGDDQGAAQLEREYARVFEKVVRLASWFDLRNAPSIRDTHDQLQPGRQSFDFDI